ncbi:MAG: HAD-IA family hydrolase [Nitrospirae bacterium]|nr:HAD-IA family hydrolase [Nitrospirota bacterium]
MRPCVIILDCDGTLVDSQRHIAAVFNETITSFGYGPMAPEAVYRVIGLSLDDALRRLLPDCPEPRRQGLINAYRARYALDVTGKNPLYNGVREFLDAVHEEGRWTAMATGKSRAGALRVVAEHDLSQHFPIIKTGDICRPKPDPDMILQILDELGLPPDRAIMVGDTTFDIEMANAAGVRAVGVTCGAHAADELANAGANLIVSTLPELTPHLPTLLPA